MITKHTDYHTGSISFDLFDEGLYMLFELMEPIIINKENIIMLSKINAFDLFLSIVRVQRLPADY